MGKTHVFGFATALKVFDLPFDIELRTVADVTEAAAQRAAAEFGFARATSDWREIILDPEIEIVDITAPNALHEEMALAAIGAGKHVYCEKPLATRSAGARRMAAAAETAGIRTQVGFNYLCNPMFACAYEMIQSGEIGKSEAVAASTARTNGRRRFPFHVSARSGRWRGSRRSRFPCARQR